MFDYILKWTFRFDSETVFSNACLNTISILKNHFLNLKNTFTFSFSSISQIYIQTST